jgi:threonylcarbamoyladenosine tRNA methylthiotransferase MtaB
LRLSSIEPTDFSRDLVDLVADPDSKICPHVHIPLQSGDDHVLELMGRPYTRAYYRDLIERIAGARRHCGIGADVMVGFPGENDAAFDSTCGLLRDLPVTYLHVFAFSRREGTVAAGLAAEVGAEAKKQRSHVLRALGADKSSAFRHSLVGEVLEAIILGAGGDRSATGLSSNYVKVTFDHRLASNTIVRAVVKRVVPGGVEAAARPGNAREEA